MVVKEIAGAIGKPEQTVRNWLRDLASKSDVIKSKLDMSSSRYPANYDLAETCLIIEEGMGKDVADAFRTNAVNAEISEKVAPMDKISIPHRQNVQPTMTASLVRAMEKLYGPDAKARIDYMIGYKPTTTPASLPAPIIINASLPGSTKAKQVGYAAAMAQERREILKAAAERAQAKLQFQ